LRQVQNPSANPHQPVVLLFSIYTSFAFGVLFLYDFTTSQAGLTFISIGIGVLLGAATSITVDRVMYQKQHHKALADGKQQAAPEHRLYSAMIGSGGIVVGLFWFGWCAGTGQHWAVCLVGAIPFAWGNICLFVSSILHTDKEGSALMETTHRHQQCCTWPTCTVRSTGHQQWRQMVSPGTLSALSFRCSRSRVRANSHSSYCRVC
jgi:hypothetical protein